MSGESKRPFSKKKKKRGMSYLQIMEMVMGPELSAAEKESIANFEKDLVRRKKPKWKGKKKSTTGSGEGDG